MEICNCINVKNIKVKNVQEYVKKVKIYKKKTIKRYPEKTVTKKQINKTKTKYIRITNI